MLPLGVGLRIHIAEYISCYVLLCLEAIPIASCIQLCRASFCLQSL